MKLSHEPLLSETCKSAEYEAFRHNCVHESTENNEVWLDRYKIRVWPTWAYSVDDATLTFADEGDNKVICKIQVVGTVQDHTWQWSWGNNSMPLKSRDRMSEAKQFGLRVNLRELHIVLPVRPDPALRHTLLPTRRIPEPRRHRCCRGRPQKTPPVQRSTITTSIPNNHFALGCRLQR